MKTNFSVTQTTNFVALAGALVVILQIFGIEIDQGQLAELLGACAVIIAAVISLINRYKKGDITLAGARKKKNS